MPLRSLGLSAAAIAAIAAATLTTAPAALAAPPAPSTASTASDTPSTTMNRPVMREDSPAKKKGDSHRYLGRVTARTGLLLRDRPTRSSRVVRSEPYGAIVHIFCRTRGDNVIGNTSWYLLTDGTWAWGSAAYIDNIGAVPRWC